MNDHEGDTSGPRRTSNDGTEEVKKQGVKTTGKSVVPADRIIKKIRRHPLATLVIVIGTIIIAVGQFFGALTQVVEFFSRFADSRPTAELQWELVGVSDRSGGKETNWNVSEFGAISWRDIFWLSAEEGWVCGAVREGGGSEDVGAGRLVHTTDGGKTWKLQANIVSGQGKFRWGPFGTRIYTWTEAGPMQSIVARRKFLGGLNYRVEGLLATTTGIYFTDNGGEEWRRITPIPTTDWGSPQYGHFSQIAVVENFNEIYAVGWQGIAHGGLDGFWEVQLPTYTHPISGIIVVGGSEGRRVWAIGQSSPSGPEGIYRLTWPANKWEEIPLNGVQLDEGEVFKDISELDKDRVIAIGTKGLLVRGSRTTDGFWKWTKLESPTQDHLYSLASIKNRLWAVGDNGAIIVSKDGGQQWALLPRITNESGAGIQLRRVKVFNDLLWVVGYGAVLRSKIPRT